MPTLYIHIGMPKTGTTALQSFLYTNRKLLVKECELYYPGIGSWNESMHRNLFPCSQNTESWHQLKTIIDREKHPTVVLSEEAIYYSAWEAWLDDFQIVQQVFSGYDIKIVCYVRRLDNFLRSWYMESIKHGGPALEWTYPYFIDYYYRKHHQFVFPSTLLNNFAKLVGRDNLLLRIYDKKTLKCANIVDDFFDLIDKKIPGDCVPPKKTNPSLPPEAIPFLLKAVVPIPRGEMRDSIQALIQTAYTWPSGGAVDDDSTRVLKEEVNRIDSFLPGYQCLYDSTPFSLQFPDIDIKNPDAVFATGLLSRVLINQQKLLEGTNNTLQSIASLGESIQSIKQEIAPQNTLVSYSQPKDCQKEVNSFRGKHKGMVFWFTGLSGAGKSTLAQIAESLLFEKGYTVIVLDGDQIRSGLCNDLTFSFEDRKENNRRVAEVAKTLARNGFICLCAIISPLKTFRQMARNIIGKDYFKEVFIDCPLEECERRDIKGFYAKARIGAIKQYTGVSDIYEPPSCPDCIIHTQDASISSCGQDLVDFIVQKIELN